MSLENSGKSRRLMHTRSIECEGFLRDDGLWEVEAWLRDTKPFTQRADHFRGELKPVVGKVVPFENFREAFKTMQSRSALGKMIIKFVWAAAMPAPRTATGQD